MNYDFIGLDQILLSFESTLKIEYNERETRRVIDSAITRIESAQGIKIDDDIYALQARNMLAADSINMLLSQIMECLKSLSLYIDISMFTRTIGISLADVNYLGFARAELKTAMQYLQDKEHYEKRSTFIPPITAAVSNIDMCTIKRLFVILLVLEKLGVSVGVSVVARLLYLGGLVS